MNYKALAVDLDGTLLHSDEQVTPRSIEVLKAAKAAGLRIIVATARWYQMAERVARQIESAEPIIACAGAQVRRPSDSHDLLDLRVPEEFANRLYPILDSRRCIAVVAMDDSVLIKMDAGADTSKLPAELAFVPRLAGAVNSLPRIFLIQGTEATGHIVEHLGEQWKERVRFVESFSSRRKSNLTITAAGADKGAALSVACADMGISTTEVVAFGDAEADIEMFRVAGASVAMGQASPHLKSIATAVTLSNDEDGVAVAVEKLLETGMVVGASPQ
ncbi:MAG TPA: HAD family hydrolase [Candidatus Binataceae bacterium]|nr:HAD family hydrolase [Candidatus Binataceae bacterium]